MSKLGHRGTRGRGARGSTRSYAPQAGDHLSAIAAASPRDAASEASTAVPGSSSTSREYEGRYLMATAESMLRAGYGHHEIERALRRMSPSPSRDSALLAAFRSLRR